jgi:hypothetical protein
MRDECPHASLLTLHVSLLTPHFSLLTFGLSLKVYHTFPISANLRREFELKDIGIEEYIVDRIF